MKAADQTKVALTIANLKKRNMDAYFFHEQVDALKAVVDRIAEHDLAAFGGSETVKQIGLVNYLTQHHANLFNRYAENISYEEKKEIERKSLLSDIFITGSNALTTSGELINIDHTGNRVSAILFGPKKVFIILGTNKIVDSLEEGIRRARTVAAPLNAKKSADKYSPPCLATGKCVECRSKDSICNSLVIINGQSVLNRITVFIIDEQLGF